jgi:hypothetical protein
VHGNWINWVCGKVAVLGFVEFVFIGLVLCLRGFGSMVFGWMVWAYFIFLEFLDLVF